MSPENELRDIHSWTEWMQPIRPMRVLFQSGDSDNPNRHYIHIFALRTSLGMNCQYLSIDGIFIEARSRSVMFAETLIDGHWLRLGA
jgi:hypothetical protein